SAKFVVEKQPDEFDGWLRYADLLKETGKPAEAVAALRKAVACSGAANDPEQWLNSLHRLAIWAEKQLDFATVEAAGRTSLEVLERYRATFRSNGFLSDGDFLIEKGDTWERIG